ncbi:hypothetical protein [Trichothermofontia sp.]
MNNFANGCREGGSALAGGALGRAAREPGRCPEENFDVLAGTHPPEIAIERLSTLPLSLCPCW